MYLIDFAQDNQLLWPLNPHNKWQHQIETFPVFKIFKTDKDKSKCITGKEFLTTENLIITAYGDVYNFLSKKWYTVNI